jgi:hypothetical protein
MTFLLFKPPRLSAVLKKKQPQRILYHNVFSYPNQGGLEATEVALNVPFGMPVVRERRIMI